MRLDGTDERGIFRAGIDFATAAVARAERPTISLYPRSQGFAVRR
jgi:hypothetical protein